ncbi:Crp/Fnr family transcriptional regulator [Desertivirga arenae]|uniref:Crp/Fnr family transcriptional regulator n=1 Tax=Desertivirga arenae TaxID=2810309 RepID=UPI001A963334|nr:Crp/Fnr family transcriptional regulator [Pedobacter sp. SYSU D00823]
MYNSLRNYITEYSSIDITDEEFTLILDAFKPKRFRKRQYFLQEGDVCKYTGFIVKGSMRQYSVDQSGNEHIVKLCIENWWAGDYESFVMLTPSKYNIDAVEDTELLLVTNESIQELRSLVPAVNRMIQVMDQRGMIAGQRRMHASISLSAEERYLELENTYPALLQRFPQTMIASYLGITPETLSRIRKQLITRLK